jgi:hypothetical protein
MFSSLLGMLTIAVPAPDTPAPALGQPPKVMAVALEKDGRPFLKAVRTEYRKEKRAATVNMGGVLVTQEYEVAVPIFLEIKVHLDDDSVQVIGADGKRVPAAQIGKLFMRPGPVLVSSDGKAVDPFYLQLLRDGGVCVIAPALATPPTPFVAPPPAVPPIRLPPMPVQPMVEPAPRQP